jgi:hypothetical protein
VLRNTIAEKVINLEQLAKDSLQVVKVGGTDTFSYLFVDLQYKVNLLKRCINIESALILSCIL